jgi:hypothetical protein
VARVFSFIPLKEVPQPLDANLDQRLTRVGLLGLMLGCQHTSMWRDMAQQFGCVTTHDPFSQADGSRLVKPELPCLCHWVSGYV